MNNKVIIVGIAIALLIAGLAPFLASSNPDGLEGAAEKFPSAEGRDYVAFDSPMPDYAIEGRGKMGEMLAIVIGTLLMAVMAYGAGMVLRKAHL